MKKILLTTAALLACLIISAQEPERKEEPKLDPRASFHGIEPKLDPRASFHGMGKKDTTPHYIEYASDKYASLETTQSPVLKETYVLGRKYKGNTKKPQIKLEDNTVVVKIWVDQYGHVQRAEPGAEGTTITNAKLWAAARKAAMDAVFDMKANAPALQEGTIIYKFNLN